MTVNLLTGAQHAPRPGDYCTKATAVAPGGDCPLWLAFLDAVMDGDQEMVDYLQRMCGYFLTGHTREHALFFAYGTGANGKSVFANTVAGIMGDYAVHSPMATFVEARNERHETELAMLRGARLVVATETEQGHHWNESRLKMLTGGDTITARFMRQDHFSFKPRFKLLISGNHKPALRGVDEAIRRRLHLIPFTVTIPPEDRDPLLPEKLRAEWPGILAWMIEGTLEWRRQGLNPPATVRDATAEYLEAEDVFGAWLAEGTVEGAPLWSFELVRDLYKSFKEWVEKAGEQPLTQKAFSQELTKRGYRPKREPGTGKGGFEGIELPRAAAPNRQQAGD